jgi:phosphoglycolate phosphatase-like HAD superfamily hydrolase
VTHLEVDGVVFDLDATLVNLGGFVDWKEASRRAVEVYLAWGYSEEKIHQCSGIGLFNMLNFIRDELSPSLPESELKHLQGKVFEAIESCETEGISHCQLMPGCIPSLEWLMEHRIKAGVATSNSQKVAEQILDLKGIRHFFTAVVGRRPELRMKPHPDQILKCFEEIRVEPGRGVVVGDSVKDVVAAKSANVYSIAVPSYFTGRDALERAGVDQLMNDLGELTRILSVLRLT